MARKWERRRGEQIGGTLVEWLNTDRKINSHSRVERLLDNLVQIWGWDVALPPAKLRELKLSTETTFVDISDLAADPESDDPWPQYSRPEVRAVRKELARHRFNIRIVHDPRNPDENLTLAWDVKTELQKMLLLLVRMDELGQLRRIRRCRHCRRWFFARKEDHWQCSVNCRIAFHHASPEFKRKRAAYMRQRRNEERERERRILAQLGKGTR
jgi:hypothetical protein